MTQPDAWTTGIQTVATQFMPFMAAVVFHEFAHGWAASKWGDTTAKDAGRLTLNPMPHIDPVGTLLFPLINMFTGIPILFGWARPVPIDPRRFRKFRAGLFWVSFAGPLMNFLLAIASANACVALLIWVPEEFYLQEPLQRMALVSVSLNFALGIFNLIPLPPLDGSKMVESILPLRMIRKYESLSRFSVVILLALMFTGAIRVISGPIEFLTRATLSVALQLMSGLG